MKIVVLMSTYNGEKYLVEQIESILAQKGEFTVELLVRDDGSMDATVDILEAYQLKGQLRWYSGENLKPAKSFWHLLQNCGVYDYYAFADQDDVWLPDKLQAAVEKLQNIEEPALYVGNVELVDANLDPLGRVLYKKEPPLDFETVVCVGGLIGCTMLFNNKLANVIQRRQVIGSFKLHDYFIAVVCKAIGGIIIYDNSVHMKYRQHANNVLGVPSTKWGAIVNRMNMLFTTGQRVSVTVQSQTCMDTYGSVILSEKIKWLQRVAHYKDSIWTRIFLACSHRIKCNSLNAMLIWRLKFLLGNS